MRRWLIALAMALVAGALWAGAAYADAGPHGKYNINRTTGLPDGTTGATSYRCASCHRAHTALGAELIKTDTQYALCTSCHGPTSDLDAIDGVEWTDPPSTPYGADGVLGGGSRAGGFVLSYMNTSLSPTTGPSFKPSTSAHRVEGMPLPGGGTSTGAYTAWGMGSTGAGNAITIACGTCHDPHGGSGGINPDGTRIPTYRILRADIAAKLGPSAGTPVVVPDVTTKVYEVADVALPTTSFWPAGSVAKGSYYGQTYEAGIGEALDNWCAQCHTRIHTSTATSDPANSYSGDPIFAFRHETTGTSSAINLGTATIRPTSFPGCVSCHTSHGSTAANQGRTSPLTIAVPGGDATTGPFLDSSLLRLDNRGVCEVCHNK